MAAVAGTSLALQFALSVLGGAGSLLSDAVTFFSYFTILSNIVVMVVAIMLARDPRRNGRLFRALRMDSLIMITVTGIVYAVMLAPLYDPQGLLAVADFGLHAAVPALTVLGWLLFGPRHRVTWAVLPDAMVLPLTWLAYTIGHGLATTWYPYPFLDIDSIGAPSALINVVAITVFGIAFGAAFLGLDRLLRGRR